MATSLMVLVGAPAFDLINNQYNALCFWVDNDGVPGFVDTLFDITEAGPVINARIIADCKADHNARFGTSFNVATPAILFGGVV